MPCLIRFTPFVFMGFLLVSCASLDSVLVPQADFKAAQQCLLQQQQQQQQLLEQQGQINQTLEKFAQLLEKPLQVKGTIVKVQNASRATACVETEAAEASANTLAAQPASQKQLVGSIEDVQLPELGLTLLGRIDTGAATASLDAQNVQVFERDGEQWVKFQVLQPESGEPIEFERKLVRRVLINQSTTNVPERRPVVELQVVIGSIAQRAEFTLADRSHLDYQALIGRNILRDMMVVDVSQKHLAPLQAKE